MISLGIGIWINIIGFSLIIGLIIFLNERKINKLSKRQFKYIKEIGLNLIYMMFDLYLDKVLDPKDFIERSLRVIFITLQTNIAISNQAKRYLTKQKVRNIFYPLLLMTMYRIRNKEEKELIKQGLF